MEELTPTQEAQNLIFKLRKQGEAALAVGDVKEFNWTQSEIARLQKSTDAQYGVERKTHARTAS